MIALGIYKIPPLWDKKNITNIKCSTNIDFTVRDLSSFREHKFRKTSIIDNTYFQMFIKIISGYNNITEANYIFIDEQTTQSYKMNYENINIWILHSLPELLYFKKANIYFLRGNYLNFYNNFVTDNSIIHFYPATSLSFSYFYKNTKKLIKKGEIFQMNKVIQKYNGNINHPFYKKITFAYIHENPFYKKIFKYSNTILFHKTPSVKFFNLKLNRIYDFIFVGDATQSTKNHPLMFDFIEYCENLKLNINIIYITNAKILKNKIDNFIDSNTLKYVSLIFKQDLSPEELNIEFNKSKINLTLSGRDAYPRTITESGLAGCFNIALDTLSDGKYFTDKYKGIILSSDKDIKLNESNSISYVKNNKLFENIYSNLKNVELDTNVIEKDTQTSKKSHKDILSNENECDLILFICQNVPGYGGASTNVYEMYIFMKTQFQCKALFIENNEQIKNSYIKSMGNKDDNVYVYNSKELQQNSCLLNESLQKYNSIYICYKISKIHKVIDRYFKNLPIQKIIYFCSGLNVINSNLINKFIENKIQFSSKNIQQHLDKNMLELDLKPIINSDITIFNSYKTYNIIKNHVNTFNIIDTSIILKKKLKTIQTKKYDILFSSSMFKRTTKNGSIVIELFKNKRLKCYNKIIIGKDFPIYDNDIENLTYINSNIQYKDFLKIVCQTKLIFIPSFYDSMPNLLYEAIINNCQVLISDTIDNNIVENTDKFSLTLSNNDIIDLIINKINDNKKYNQKILNYQQQEKDKFLNLFK